MLDYDENEEKKQLVDDKEEAIDGTHDEKKGLDEFPSRDEYVPI